MLRKAVFVAAVIAALALLCSGAAVSTSNTNENEVLHRSKRFSIEGFVECTAMLGLVGINDILNNIEDHCNSNWNTVRYDACVIKQIAKLGPEYVKCVAKS